MLKEDRGFYIAQCPVRGSAQNALPFPIADLFSPTPTVTRLRWEAASPASFMQKLQRCNSAQLYTLFFSTRQSKVHFSRKFDRPGKIFQDATGNNRFLADGRSVTAIFTILHSQSVRYIAMQNYVVTAGYINAVNQWPSIHCGDNSDVLAFVVSTASSQRSVNNNIVHEDRLQYMHAH